MTTTERVNVLKEIIATSFMLATEKSMGSGISFTYKSYPVDIPASENNPEFKAWHFDIIVKELGYGEHTVQQFKFPRPNNIDAKHMEYHVLIEVIASLTQTSLLTYYEVAKILSTDKEMQKEIIHETAQSNFTSDQPE
jgi:hypothetical protein